MSDPPSQPTQPLTDEALDNIRARHEDPMIRRDPDKARLIAEVDRLRAENTALRASLDQFRYFPDNPGPGNWSASYRMGYAEAGKDVRALTHALGLDQDGRGQTNG